MTFTYRLSDIEPTASQILKYVESKNIFFQEKWALERQR